ncbi:GDP-L-fucose synthase [Desulfomicrobium sp. ZS1]|uniref:GDP-L-fucose synthase family protein n=1 Tax=Desulfomicrobium sp. ZS1 TaxID=2952228 RepID=UPI0020B40D01|nr:GDP-L-fucose synthase [Desulfomicrobium sp. ZS1]UTF50090.1 GDP-L-fucose synthase [Desulfomicrobium sp. ZS1]
MNKADKILVAGAAGMVGSALVRALLAQGFENILGTIHRKARDFGPTAAGRVRLEPLDLMDQASVRAFFERERPDHVFLAAAKVGGIHANNTCPADFIHANLAIQTGVIHSAYQAGVQRLLFLGSSCIYPRDCPQPIRESYLLTGPLEATNRPYAVAKIAGIEMCWAYSRQYGTRYLAVMPTNLYGPGDNYDLQTSHVLPALIRKAHEAKVRGERSFTVWGTGTPRREFLYSDDLADACVYLMSEAGKTESLFNDQEPPLVNIGCGEDVTIAELAGMVAETVGFEGEIVFDASKPDGTPQKLLDVSLINDMGWRPSVALQQGIWLAYGDFVESLG